MAAKALNLVIVISYQFAEAGAHRRLFSDQRLNARLVRSAVFGDFDRGKAHRKENGGYPQ